MQIEAKPAWAPARAAQSLFGNYEGRCFRGKGRMARRRRRCARPPQSNSEGIREQGEARRPFPRKPSGRRVFWLWLALARSLQPAAGRCARPRPSWPQPKSLAPAPLVVSKQALGQARKGLGARFLQGAFVPLRSPQRSYSRWVICLWSDLALIKNILPLTGLIGLFGSN